MPEPDLDDNGPVLALMRPSGRRIQEGEPVMHGKDEPTALNHDHSGVDGASGRDSASVVLSELSEPSKPSELGRRDMLKITAGSVVSAATMNDKLKAEASAPRTV